MNIDIKLPHEVDELCGTKASTLTELKKLGIQIPDFYAVSSSAFEIFCKEAQIPTLESFFANSEFDQMTNKKNIAITNRDEIVQKIDETSYMVRSSSVPANDIDLKMFPSMISGAFESYYASSASEAIDNISNVWKSVFLEKAYNQCRMFSELSIVKGMGVLIQKYIEPVISGVAHAREGIVSVNWIEGHLSRIVNGEAIGNIVDVYISSEKNYILRGIESNILLIKNNNYENVFKCIFDIANTIKRHFDYDQEIEWIYDGVEIWIVQSQSLIIDK